MSDERNNLEDSLAHLDDVMKMVRRHARNHIQVSHDEDHEMYRPALESSYHMVTTLEALGVPMDLNGLCIAAGMIASVVAQSVETSDET